MPSLLAILGLDAANFSAGLDKAIQEAGNKSKSLEGRILDVFKSSKIAQAIASPVGAAAAVLIAVLTKSLLAFKELEERAASIKKLSSSTNLDRQTTQRVFYAAQGADVDPDAIGRSILKVAEAQEKVKEGGAGAAEALKHFTTLGVTMADIQAKSYDKLFFQIAEGMNVAKVNGQQLAAVAELTGRSFEELEPMFKRGFNNPVDQMQMLTDGEIRRLDALNIRAKQVKMSWHLLWQEMGNDVAWAASKLPGQKAALEQMDQDTAMKRNQAKIDERLAREAAAKNAAALKHLETEKKVTVEKEKQVKAEETSTREYRHRTAENEVERIGGIPIGAMMTPRIESLQARSLIIQEQMRDELIRLNTRAGFNRETKTAYLDSNFE